MRQNSRFRAYFAAANPRNTGCSIQPPAGKIDHPATEEKSATTAIRTKGGPRIQHCSGFRPQSGSTAAKKAVEKTQLSSAKHQRPSASWAAERSAAQPALLAKQTDRLATQAARPVACLISYGVTIAIARDGAGTMPQEDFVPNHRVLKAFIKWIESPRFDQRYAMQWGKRYKADPEAAMCEAMSWAVLSLCGVDVEPNEGLTGQKPSPDFRCSKSGAKFYVEVTCIQVDTATRKSKLEPVPTKTPGAQHYRHLNDAIFRECINKTPQCANQDAPCALFVGTFHHQASVHCIQKTFIEELITGESYIECAFDPVHGRAAGEPHEATSLRLATFSRMNSLGAIEDARQPISALLVGGFGCEPPHVFGLLHPKPRHKFEPSLLERIPFCDQKVDLIQGTIAAEWVQLPETRKPR